MALMFRLAADLPLVPGLDEARRWAQEELAKSEYAAAEPTPLDRIAQAIGDFLQNLFTARGPQEWDSLLGIVVISVVILLLLAALLIWGRPRALRRSRTIDDELFGRSDRTAVELRRQAEARATAEDWDNAIVLRLRALARALVERGIIDPVPGATVHAFAREAARAFPGEQARLHDAAEAFDDVRYLRRPGNREMYAIVVDADSALAAARPVALGALAETLR